MGGVSLIGLFLLLLWLGNRTANQSLRRRLAQRGKLTSTTRLGRLRDWWLGIR